MQNNQSLEKYDVFISYSRQDYEIVNDTDGKKSKKIIPDNPILKIVDKLKNEGISYWYDQEGVSARFEEIIATNIECCKMMIFVSSKASVNSKYTLAEIKYAIDHDKQILVFKIDDTPIKKAIQLLLSTMNYIDTYQKQPENSLSELVKCVKTSLKQIKEEELQKELERKEKERLEKEAAERKAIIANLNADIAELVQQEAAANSARQNLATKIATTSDKKIREDFIAKLDEVGVLHQEIVRKERLRVKSKQKLLLSLIVTMALAMLAMFFLITRWAVYTKKTSKYENELSSYQSYTDSLKNREIELQDSLTNLKNQIDSLQVIAGGKVYVAKLSVEKNQIELPASSGCYVLKVNSNTDWEITGVPADAFYNLKANNKQVNINYETNMTTTKRISAFNIVSKQDKSKLERIQLTQAASGDTIIPILSPSVEKEVEQNGVKGIKIKFPFKANYISGELYVRAYFYDTNGNQLPTRKNEGYYITDKTTGAPKLASKEVSLNCREVGTAFPNFSIFMPYSVFNNQQGEIKYQIVFYTRNRILYATDKLTICL